MNGFLLGTYLVIFMVLNANKTNILQFALGSRSKIGGSDGTTFCKI